MKIGIMVDTWKGPIFKAVLEKAGYEFNEFVGPPKGVITLTVETDSVEDLKTVVRSAYTKCKRQKMN